jgi:hypothetical protein
MISEVKQVQYGTQKLEWPEAKVSIWDHQSGGSKLTGNSKDDLSANSDHEYWVQADSPSASLRDVQLKVSYEVSNETAVDKVRVTAVGMEIENHATRDSDDIQIQKTLEQSIPLKIYYKIVPITGFIPDSVKMKVLDCNNNVVKEIILPTVTGEQSIIWDGKDSNNKMVNYGNYKVVIEVEISSLTCASNNHNFTVYMIRLGNCVYRDLMTELNEHAGLLYSYTGNENVREHLDDHDNYIVMEHPGGNGTMCFITLSDFMEVDTYHGEWCPSNVNRDQRKQILDSAQSLYFLDPPYIDDIHHILEYEGMTWGGTLEDITRLRCDGLTEVSYEKNGILLWGSNLMNSQVNLNQHYNNLLFTKGCTPKRQRLGGGGATTANEEDKLYLPTE